MTDSTLQTIRDALVHGRNVLNMRNLQLDVGPIHSAIKMVDEELARVRYVDFAPAFPVPANEPIHSGTSGMTIEDYFAAQAMMGELACQNEASGHYERYDVLASKAYKVAKEMLKARK